MTFQETHVSDNTLSIINTQFQARYSMWTRHCGIVSFNPSFIFSDNLVPENDRIILTKVKHPYNAFEPFWLLVLYAPATSCQQRQQFFDHVLGLLHNKDLDINLDRLFITGGFNYSYLRPHLSSQTSLQWVSFLNDHFYNALMKDDLHEIPTFRRNETTYSTIDYIFTDHSLLSVTCYLGPSPSGPGLWRGNPLLARKPAYQQYLRQHLDDILLKIPSGWNAQKKWDFVKQQVKKVTRNFAIDYSDWRKKMIRQLQSDRNRFLRSKPSLDARLQHLTILDQPIASLQQELSETLALKANVRWQEAGEKSVKYLKNLYRQRTVEQHITTLRLNDSTDPVESTDRMLTIAQHFYQSLFTTDPVDDHQVEHYLDDIHDLPQLTEDHTDHLLEPITIEKIMHETVRVENKVSSPGEDGLGYAFLYQLFRYPLLHDLN
ncbi:hypothetical protein G6F32_011601 [Rhizopus arrhizus]|nr:hypothetical protein G6F32_011601 [Rhizopus arrhizus]